MRLPNGYGSVVKLKGKRRNPYWVRLTDGYNDKGHPIYKTLGYTRTKKLGLEMLASYHADPYDLDKVNTTMEELFEKYQETERFKRLADSSQRTMKVSFRKAKSIHHLAYSKITYNTMQDVVLKAGKYSSQSSMKTLFKHLDDFAYASDVINKKNSESIIVDNVKPVKHINLFTEDEIKTFWEHQENTWSKNVLILLYTGLRVSEYLNLKIENIRLEDDYFIAGGKTKAGTNRKIPIHSRIKPFLEEFVEENGELLKTRNGTRYDYRGFKYQFDKLLNAFEMEHIIHETRHTFRSRMDSAGAQKSAIDLIMGHSTGDVGLDVYTHKSVAELKKNVELLK